MYIQSMGGNALNSIGLSARRITSAELFALAKELQEINNEFQWLEPVKFYHEKDDHGDIDLIGLSGSCGMVQIAADVELPKWGIDILQTAKSKGYFWNNPVLSFEFKGVQIDIVGKENEEDAIDYLHFCNYSPTGNIVGRMLKQTGAKWGVDGLTYPVRESWDNEANMIGTIRLSHDVSDVFKIAGIEPGIWQKGFDKQSEIFAFCVESHLFNKEIFAFENLNHVNRKRDRLRGDYHAWLKYIEDKPDKYKRYASLEERAAKKEEWLDVLNDRFPFLKEQKALIIEDFKTRQGEASKFNGHLVREWTGLSGRDLAVAISAFKSSFASEEEFLEWRRITSPAEIKKHFLDFKMEEAVGTSVLKKRKSNQNQMR